MGMVRGVRLPGKGMALCRVLLWAAVSVSAGGAEPAGFEAMRLLRANCVSCHNDEKQKGGLVLTSREAMMKGGESGAVVVEGKPDESPLIKALAPEADPHMPPKKQLTASKIEVLKEWIRARCPWDAAALAGAPSAARPVALAPLPAGYRPVMALALSPDGKRLAAACRNDVILFEVTPTGLGVSGEVECTP